MRRIAVSVGLLLIGCALPAAGAQPSAGAGAGQSAEAWWVDMNGSNGTLYIAAAERSVTAAGVSTTGMVAVGDCRRSRGKHFEVVFCMAKGRAKELGLEGFQMDPALRSASLEMRAAGQTHTAEWDAKGTPSFGEGASWGEWGAFAGAGAGVGASASGRLFGRDVNGRCDLCYLEEGAGAFAVTGVTRSIDVDGDEVTARLRIKTRR